MSQTGKLVGLQGIAGSGEKKFPGWLGVGTGHDSLQFISKYVCDEYPNAKDQEITSNPRINGLWKSVEIVENPERTCSACTGDYEDPDRSTWTEEPEEAEAEEVADERGNEG